MEIIFSEKAKKRLDSRNHIKEKIIEVVKNPDLVTLREDGSYKAEKLTYDKSNNPFRIIKVLYNIKDDRIEIFNVLQKLFREEN